MRSDAPLTSTTAHDDNDEPCSRLVLHPIERDPNDAYGAPYPRFSIVLRRMTGVAL